MASYVATIFNLILLIKFTSHISWASCTVAIDHLQAEEWSGAKLKTASNYPIILSLYRYIVGQEYRALYG